MNSNFFPEKIDVLLALAVAFDRKFARLQDEKQNFSIRETADKSFSALNDDDSKKLKDRAEYLDNLSEENRAVWVEATAQKIQRRGRVSRLDDNVNTTQLAARLALEPKLIQSLILQNLPDSLTSELAPGLDLEFMPDTKDHGKKIDTSVSTLIKQSFLEEFTLLEDVYEADQADKLTVSQLKGFIYFLGLREIAIACRGIASKESLAALLNRFNSDDAKEIALQITELEKVKPRRVSQADEIVRENWDNDSAPEKIIEKIGLQVLANLFSPRPATSINYTAQKLSVEDAANFKSFVENAAQKTRAANNSANARAARKTDRLNDLAVRFIQQENE